MSARRFLLRYASTRLMCACCCPATPESWTASKTKRLLATLSNTGMHGEVRLLEAELPGSGVPLLVIDYPLFYERDGGPYIDHNGHDWVDNAQRFALLSKVGAILGSSKSPLALAS